MADSSLGKTLGTVSKGGTLRATAIKVVAVMTPLAMVGVIGAGIALGVGIGNVTTNETSKYPATASVIRPACHDAGGGDASDPAIECDNGSTNANGTNATSSGSGQDYASASDAQRRVADACKSVPSPGAGLCAMWVSRVYDAAGLGYPTGNACDMYDRYCTSKDRSELKVGMMVAVRTHSLTSAGSVYGHIGIYVGDGQVMDNVGRIGTTPLDKWIGTYEPAATSGDGVRWGFGPGLP